MNFGITINLWVSQIYYKVAELRHNCAIDD